MTKMYRKDELKFENGYILTKDNEIVGIPPLVYDELLNLDLRLQKIAYLLSQPSYHPAPSLEGFKATKARKIETIRTPTPLLDAEFAKSMNILDEIRKKEIEDRINDFITSDSSLIDWINSDYILDNGVCCKLELNYLGNPLELTIDEYASALRIYFRREDLLMAAESKSSINSKFSHADIMSVQSSSNVFDNELAQKKFDELYEKESERIREKLKNKRLGKSSKKSEESSEKIFNPLEALSYPTDVFKGLRSYWDCDGDCVKTVLQNIPIKNPFSNINPNDSVEEESEE